MVLISYLIPFFLFLFYFWCVWEIHITETHSWHVQTYPRRTEESSKRCPWQDWTYAKRWKENFQCIFFNKFLSPPAKLWSVYVGTVDAMELKENFKRSFYLAQKEEGTPNCTFLYKKSSNRFVFSYDCCMERPGKRDPRCCYVMQWYPVMFLKW